MRSKNTLYNVLMNLILQIVTIIYGFIVPKIIIEQFGSNVNGLITSITQFLAYITLLESGFGPVVKSLLYKPIAQKNNNEIANILYKSEVFFKKITMIFILYVALLCVFYPFLINNEFSYIFTFSLIIIISISTLVEYYFGMTYRLFLQANQKNYIISIVQTITYLLNIVIIILLAKLNVSIHLIKLISCLVFIFRPVFLNIYVKRKYSISFDNINKDYKIKNQWDGLVQHIASVIHGNTDITLLSIFSTLSEVSVYSVYMLIVNGLKQVIQIFSNGIDAMFGDMIAKNEDEKLNKNFNLYEILFYSISTIIFTVAIVLIVPFVSIYTTGINDANYIRYTFGYLIVISEYIWAIRLPYSSITLAAGHFKETKKGAWIECIVNLTLSILLVLKFGIIGVTIGTIVSMFIRTIEFMYHTNKYILKRSMFYSLKKVLFIIIESILIIFIYNFIPLLEYTSYLNWCINAVLISCISILVVFFITILFFKEECQEIKQLLKKVIKR